MKRVAKLVGVLIVVAVTLWVGYFFYQHHRFVITDNAFQMADIVNVSTQNVSGKIIHLYKKEFQEVKREEPLFKVDDKIYREEEKSLQKAVEALRERKEKLKIQLERLKEELPASLEKAVKGYQASVSQIRSLKEEIERAEVNYESAVNTAKAQLKAAKESLRAAQESYQVAKRKFERFKNLYLKRVISKQQYEEVKAAYYGALARLEEAKANYRAAEENLKSAESSRFKVEGLKERLKALGEKSLAIKEEVKYAKAQLKRVDELKRAIKEVEKSLESKEAQLEKVKELVRETLVRAPVGGVVAKRWKEVGEFVSPGLPVYSIYDPKSFYVLAWIDEDKVRFVKVGGEVRAELEACKEEFKGRVTAVGSSAGSVFALIPRDTSQGEYTRVTQRVPVKVKLEGVPTECIKPGTNVTVYIKKE